MSASGGINPEKVLIEIYSHIERPKKQDTSKKREDFYTRERQEAISEFFKKTLDDDQTWVTIANNLGLPKGEKNFKQQVIHVYSDANKTIIRENNLIRAYLRKNGIDEDDIPDTSDLGLSHNPLDDHIQLREFLKSKNLLLKLVKELDKDLKELARVKKPAADAPTSPLFILLDQLLDDWIKANADPISEAILQNFDLTIIETLLKKGAKVTDESIKNAKYRDDSAAVITLLRPPIKSNLGG